MKKRHSSSSVSKKSIKTPKLKFGLHGAGKKKNFVNPRTIITIVVVALLLAAFFGWLYFTSYDVEKHKFSRSVVKIDKPHEVGDMKLGPPLQANHTPRQAAVVKAFNHAWKAYRKYAWGKDELKPVSKTSNQWFKLGLTLVDSLDTMWLMGLTQQFTAARNWVANEMKIAQDVDVNLFETTIRVLGGLLSAYHLSEDKVFLEKAVELGDRLLPCFDSKSYVPFSDVNLLTGHAHAPEWGPDSSVSEVSTIQMEFRDLAMLTGNDKYKVAVDQVMEKLQSLPKKDNLVPLFINAEAGQLRPGTLTMGARADTYYEYLLKQWIQSAKTEKRFREWFLLSMKGVERHLLRHSEPSHLTFIGEELLSGEFYPKMDHLVCYLPGTLLLGVHNGLSRRFASLAEQLMYTCYKMYEKMPTGLSPEIVHFNMSKGSTQDIYVKECCSLSCYSLTYLTNAMETPEFHEALAYAFTCTDREDLTLKPKQEGALVHFLDDRDVFAWFHTSYGKSLCYQLLPFMFDFKLKQMSSPRPLDRHNLLRPESVESLFYLYRLTRDNKYRDWGWNIFQAFEQYTKLDDGGYTSINDVTNKKNVHYRDKMESFFLGETLKYLFLLFSDDFSVINLDKWIVNTEAHPLPIWLGYYFDYKL